MTLPQLWGNGDEWTGPLVFSVWVFAIEPALVSLELDRRISASELPVATLMNARRTFRIGPLWKRAAVAIEQIAATGGYATVSIHVAAGAPTGKDSLFLQAPQLEFGYEPTQFNPPASDVGLRHAIRQSQSPVFGDSVVGYIGQSANVGGPGGTSMAPQFPKPSAGAHFTGDRLVNLYPGLVENSPSIRGYYRTADGVWETYGPLKEES